MPFLGISLMELMVILILAALLIGPDKLPQFAADLAKWIRQTRAYAKHLMGDFNQVISDLEKEAGASREDWQEIASVVTRHTGSLGKELTRVAKDIEDAGDLSESKREEPEAAATTNGASTNGANGAHATHEDEPAEEEATEPAAKPETAEERPWYEPERASRRRSRE